MQKSTSERSTLTGQIGFRYVWRNFMRDRCKGAKDRGATAVEYGLLIGLIAVAMLAAVTLVGTNLDLLFERIAAAL